MTKSLNYYLKNALSLLPLFLGYGFSLGASASTEFELLRETYVQTRTELSNSVFHQPLTINSSFEEDLATGEIYAVIETEFNAVSSRLINSTQWCGMLELHINVKGCYVLGQNDESQSTESANKKIRLYVGRNFYQPIEDAYVMEYQLAIPKRAEDYLKATLTANEGPFGTSKYLLEFEAIPVAENKTFIHFKYSYQYGFFARVALEGYLATLGRKKVGFTIDKYDENNQPVYVKGVQGIIERNSMRYFIAIRAFLDTFTLGTNGWNKRVDYWYQLALPYERQLLEVKDRKYIDTKYEEFEKRVSLDTTFNEDN